MGFSQIGPGLRRRDVALLRLDGVEADQAHPGVHACPGRRVGRVPETRLQLLVLFRCVRFEHAELVEADQVHQRHAPDDVGARVILLSEQSCEHDAGAVAKPRDLDIRMRFLEGSFVGRKLFLLQCGIDRDGLLAGLGEGRRSPRDDAGQQTECPAARCGGAARLGGISGHSFPSLCFVAAATLSTARYPQNARSGSQPSRTTMGLLRNRALEPKPLSHRWLAFKEADWRNEWKVILLRPT